MEMDAKAVLEAGSIVISLATFFYARYVQSISALKKDHDRNADDIIELRAKLAGMPTMGEVHELKITITKMEGTINVVQEQLKPVQAQLGRIENFMSKISDLQAAATAAATAAAAGAKSGRRG